MGKSLVQAQATSVDMSISYLCALLGRLNEKIFVKAPNPVFDSNMLAPSVYLDTFQVLLLFPFIGHIKVGLKRVGKIEFIFKH